MGVDREINKLLSIMHLPDSGPLVIYWHSTHLPSGKEFWSPPPILWFSGRRGIEFTDFINQEEVPIKLKIRSNFHTITPKSGSIFKVTRRADKVSIVAISATTTGARLVLSVVVVASSSASQLLWHF